MIRATVLAQVDDNDIMNCLVRFFNERIELKSQNDSLRKENEDLRRQIAELTPQIVSEEKISLSKQKLIEGWKLHGKGDYKGAIKLYDEAIRINPNNADAYHNRGVALRALDETAKAQFDFAKAKQLGW